MPPNSLRCDFCTYTAIGMQGRSAHMRWCKDNPKRLTKVTKTNGQLKVHKPRTIRKLAEAEKDLVAMVTLAYPHGIQTTDQDRLEDDLRWIAHTSRVLGRK